MIGTDINKILLNVLADGDINLSNTEKLLDIVIDEIYIKNQYDLVSITTQELAKKIIDIIRSQPNIVRENFRILHLLFGLSILLRVAPVVTIKDQYHYLLAKFLNLDEFSKQYRLVARSTSFKNFATGTANYFFDDEFYHKMELKEQERSIYMYFYASTAYSGSSKEHMENMYPELYKVFLKAIDLKQSDLVFYLYTPLLYSYNSLATTQKEFKFFNDKVESKLSEYIKTVMIPFHNIKPNDKVHNKKKNSKIKVAFIQERIFNYSINKVFKSLLKVLKENNSDKYEFVILDINFAELGSEPEEVKKIKEFGFRYVDLHKKFVGQQIPFYSTVSKAIAIRKYIMDEGFDIIIGGNGRPEFNFLYTTRSASKHIFWSHGNFEYDMDEIDLKVSHSYEDDNFTQINIPKNRDELYNPYVNSEKINKERLKYPKDTFILGSIGRLIKLDSDEYLETVAKIMKQNPNTIYLACGKGDRENIKKKLKHLGVEDRWYFTGQINSHLYGHVIDLYLSPFPNGGGEALEEYKYKGKPYVRMYDNTKNLKFDKSLKKLVEDISLSNSEFHKSILYTKEILNKLLNNGYLNKNNKLSQNYISFSFAKTSADYINITNEMINYKNIRDKVVEELMYYANNRVYDFDSFYRLLK